MLPNPKAWRVLSPESVFRCPGIAILELAIPKHSIYIYTVYMPINWGGARGVNEGIYGSPMERLGIYSNAFGLQRTGTTDDTCRTDDTSSLSELVLKKLKSRRIMFNIVSTTTEGSKNNLWVC